MKTEYLRCGGNALSALPFSMVAVSCGEANFSAKLSYGAGGADFAVIRVKKRYTSPKFIVFSNLPN